LVFLPPAVCTAPYLSPTQHGPNDACPSAAILSIKLPITAANGYLGMLLYFNGSYHPIVSGFFFEQKLYQHHSGVVNTKKCSFLFFLCRFLEHTLAV
jgi:hypothetical protein